MIRYKYCRNHILFVNRLSKLQIKELLKRYSGGGSLTKISREMAIPKGVVYYHVRKKFGRKYKPVILNLKDKEKLGEFIGAFAGDGGFFFTKKTYKYEIFFHFSFKEAEYAERISEISNSLFGKKAYIWFDNKNRTIRVRIMGKVIYEILKKYLSWSGKKSHTIALKRNVLNSSLDLLRGIARGLINSDGSVYIPKNRIAFGTVSVKLCRQFSYILRKFSINHHIYPVEYKKKKTLYHIHITGLKNVSLFNKKIGITNQYKKSQLRILLKNASVVQPG